MLTPSLRKPDAHPQNRTVKPGDAFETLKALRLSVGSKLSTSKQGRRGAALHSFVELIFPIDSRHQVESDKCNFPSHYASINPSFTAEKNIGL
jgi:hypothetical protein